MNTYMYSYCFNKSEGDFIWTVNPHKLSWDICINSYKSIIATVSVLKILRLLYYSWVIAYHQERQITGYETWLGSNMVG